jgi:outer membrane protein OmpA-like peptidoglycan-associated protein
MLESFFGKSKNQNKTDEDQWLSVSDLMAGLMIVFLFISIVLMRNALIERDTAKEQAKTYQGDRDRVKELADRYQIERDKVKELAARSQDERDKVKELADRYQIERDKVREIAASYQANKIDIYNALLAEFETDLPLWDAEIQKDNLSFNFKSPEVLFGEGETTLNPKFEEILDDFFPRYLGVIERFKKSIQEVRIEGHTSSRWNTETSENQSYFNNMNLSQGRTRSVLSYIYYLKSIASQRPWIKANIAAVGLSSSKLIFENGKEDEERSRRVTFRLVTNSETQILRIIGGVE